METQDFSQILYSWVQLYVGRNFDHFSKNVQCLHLCVHLFRQYACLLRVVRAGICTPVLQELGDVGLHWSRHEGQQPVALTPPRDPGSRGVGDLRSLSLGPYTESIYQQGDIHDAYMVHTQNLCFHYVTFEYSGA